MRFYHIYPLGFCGAPPTNEHARQQRSDSEPGSGLLPAVARHLDYVREHGFDALYLGPLFQSSTHGYDTADYYHVDSRLGPDADLVELVRRAHELGIKVVLDGVFNHVGRDFWAFRDVLENREQSAYTHWFKGLRFDADNRFGDGLVYEGWEGVEELVALNHDAHDVAEHLYGAALSWINQFEIDGIRLDVAYSLPFWFLEELGRRTRAARDDFWLLGEVIHGDYASFVEPGRLDSITNYECYKGLWSSFNDANLFEIAHSLGRLFGDGGMLATAVARRRLPYNFSDNHDVDRLASSLTDPAHIYPALALLWGMPGYPALYYGTEFGVTGSKDEGDAVLRPAWSEVEHIGASETGRQIDSFVKQLNQIRAVHPVLEGGEYRQVSLDNTALVFERSNGEQTILVAVSAESGPRSVSVPSEYHGRYRSLYSGEELQIDGDAPIDLPPYGSAYLLRRL